MGAIITSVLVIVIAVVGYVYFNRQDKVLSHTKRVRSCNFACVPSYFGAVSKRRWKRDYSRSFA